VRSYELAYIADPDLDEEAISSLEERVKSWIEGVNGKTLNVDRWGKRKLAYPIQKQSEGYYFIMQTEIPPEAGRSLEQNLRLNEQILRYLITSKS
jgi:small subunit ribosomal protein S6